MPLNHALAPPLPMTPPVFDVSRSQLKQLAQWIRDDLDLLVAREGPDILRPDDVLTLHELFIALHRSTTVTALDLRATGIHIVMKDIAGIATRWPSRLCDDCDKIVTKWTSKFGPFDELRPFLYGRGGRLEGIASVTEYSREALLKRWSEHCPEKIHPRVSHRQGDLGFKAGDWWINALFAHHAGIIGLESVEGGTTYDKDCAYALVLKDTGEIDARSEDVFTYRCPISDKGKFRLTAATPSSRELIRVLRSHSVNSIWGPKAGIRYDGLHSVQGWCVRQARLKDTITGECKEGEIIYEVTMRRKDPVPIDQVTRRPVNMEVDDYTEYKRLRKLHRENKRRAPGPTPMPQQASKAAPPILPPQPSASPTVAPQSLLRVSSSVSSRSIFKESTFDASKVPRKSGSFPTIDVASQVTTPDLQDSFFAPRVSGTMTIPNKKEKDRNGQANLCDTSSPDDTLPVKHVRVLGPGAGFLVSSTCSTKGESTEITPWIELDGELTTPPLLNAPAEVKDRGINKAMDQLEVRAARMNPVKNVRRLARDSRQPSDSSWNSQKVRGNDTATIVPNLRLHPARAILGKKEKGKEGSKEKRSRKVVFKMKSKFFDGTGYSADEEEDDDSDLSCSFKVRRSRSSSADSTSRLHSPTPIRPLRSNRIFNYGIEDIEFTSPLDNLISRPRMASPVNSLMSTPVTSPGGSRMTGESVALGRLKRWLSK